MISCNNANLNLLELLLLFDRQLYFYPFVHFRINIMAVYFEVLS